MSAAETTLDTVLGGRLRIGQPARGHRAGTDAILAAAAVPARQGDVIADFGAGVGTAGLAVLVRVPETRAVLIEIDLAAAELAEANVLANDLSARARVLTIDAADAGRGLSAGLAGTADHLVSNPPFNSAAGREPPEPATARARVAQEGQFEDWMRAAARVLKPGGSVTLIHKPEALPGVLGALTRRFGGIVLRFVHPDAHAPAARVLIQARKDSRAPLKTLPPLILNKPGGGFTLEAEALHRDLAPLSMA